MTELLQKYYNIELQYGYEMNNTSLLQQYYSTAAVPLQYPISIITQL
jgi:hypothetical protein